MNGKSLLVSLSSIIWMSLSAVNAAQWEINQEQSEINFISVKKGTVAEIHHFDNFYGVLNDDGSFLIDIALDSVETNIDIRNQRMNDFLFETKRHPIAVLLGEIEPSAIEKLKVGEQVSLDTPAQLRLHGKKSQISLSLLITKMKNGALHVASKQPTLINANAFDLVKGIDKLKELAALPSIDLVVPVTFNTVWTSNKHQ